MNHALQSALATVLCAIVALASAAARAETPFVNDPQMDAPSSVREGKKWREQAIRMPAWPKDADLVEIKLDGPTHDFRYSIDIRNLATGSDDVVRYPLVTQSKSGGRNVSFEGLRCTPNGAYKTYAYGSGSRFSPTNVAEQWQQIDERSRDRFRYELWRHYLCVHRLFKPRDRKDQIRMLKSGRVPQVESAGFMSN